MNTLLAFGLNARVSRLRWSTWVWVSPHGRVLLLLVISNFAVYMCLLVGGVVFYYVCFDCVIYGMSLSVLSFNLFGV